jgi:hypothetical protein
LLFFTAPGKQPVSKAPVSGPARFRHLLKLRTGGITPLVFELQFIRPVKG